MALVVRQTSPKKTRAHAGRIGGSAGQVQRKMSPLHPERACVACAVMSAWVYTMLYAIPTSASQLSRIQRRASAESIAHRMPLARHGMAEVWCAVARPSAARRVNEDYARMCRW